MKRPFFAALLLGLLPIGQSAYAGELISIVPVTGSASMKVFGINDSNITVGSWFDANGLERGYFGPLDGSNYTTFDFSPSGTEKGTEPRGINNDNYITGFANSQGQAELYRVPFERAPDGTIAVITNNGNAMNGGTYGIDNSQYRFAGSYINNQAHVLGYIGQNFAYLHNVTVPFQNDQVSPRAINSAGDIVGWYRSYPVAARHGFLEPPTGLAQAVNYPGSSQTSLEGINDNSIISGSYVIGGGDPHGFTYDMGTGVFTPFSISISAQIVQPYGINSNGLIAISADSVPYIYCSNPLKSCPGGH